MESYNMRPCFLASFTRHVFKVHRGSDLYSSLWLNRVLLCGFSTFRVSICIVMDAGVLPPFGDCEHSPAANIRVHDFVWVFSLLWGKLSSLSIPWISWARLEFESQQDQACTVSQEPWFPVWVSHKCWPWVSPFPSLCLSFLRCKNEVDQISFYLLSLESWVGRALGKEGKTRQLGWRSFFFSFFKPLSLRQFDSLSFSLLFFSAL